MRENTRDLRADLRGQVAELRAERQADLRSLYGELGHNRRLLLSMWVTTLLGFAGLIVEAGLR